MRNTGLWGRLLTSGVTMILILTTPLLGHALAALPMQVPRIVPVPAASRQQPLDLNTAGIADLRKLPGIGDAYAKRIVEGRPYTSKNQLVTRGVLPQNAYEGIKEIVVAHRPPAK